jgi:diguanylate cyclase (GGDEF)-like protein
MSDVRRMATLAGIDPLTHLLNRRGFEAHMESLQRHRGDVPFGLVCLDLNGLKVINDRFGHSVGDKALVLIAQRLRSATRSYDVMARLGGDEFCVLLPGASMEETSDVADRLRSAARGDIVHEGSHLAITTAVGWSHSSQSFDDMYRAADSMMYADKPAESRFEA